MGRGGGSGEGAGLPRSLPLRHARQGVPPFAGAASSPAARLPYAADQVDLAEHRVLRTRPALAIG